MENNQEKSKVSEKEAMQKHYDHYKNLSDSGKLTDEDRQQWEIAQQRKQQGLVE